MDTIYTESAGTTCYIAAERGVVTGFHSEAKRLVGAFVRLDESGEMLFVSLGKATGERRQWHEVTGSRRITRDEFDGITTLDALRRDLGWAAGTGSPLTEAEREALHSEALCGCDDLLNCRNLATLYRDVESLIAARVAQ